MSQTLSEENFYLAKFEIFNLGKTRDKIFRIKDGRFLYSQQAPDNFRELSSQGWKRVTFTEVTQSLSLPSFSQIQPTFHTCLREGD